MGHCEALAGFLDFRTAPENIKNQSPATCVSGKVVDAWMSPESSYIGWCLT